MEHLHIGASSHPLSQFPNKAWEQLRKTQVVNDVNVPLTTETVSRSTVRFVCMSDTHSRTDRMSFNVPAGDVFLHAGDFTMNGSVEEVIHFNEFLGSLPHKYKIIIAGNHELSFDPIVQSSYRFQSLKRQEKAKKYLTNCIYLEDSLVKINDISIYGTPWQPKYHNWAFNVNRGQDCLRIWDKIPSGIDILLTHTPPVGHGDLTYAGIRAGCVDLLLAVQQRIKPKFHVFGHIHEGYGVTCDEQTTFINCSTCNLQYLPVNPPIVFDVATKF